MMGVALEIKELQKSDGQNHARSQFSYRLTEGIYGLFVPNGAGKLTLMILLLITFCLIVEMSSLMENRLRPWAKIIQEYNTKVYIGPLQLPDSFFIRDRKSVV